MALELRSISGGPSVSGGVTAAGEYVSKAPDSKQGIHVNFFFPPKNA